LEDKPELVEAEDRDSSSTKKIKVNFVISI
jgi:hypothetical protein